MGTNHESIFHGSILDADYTQPNEGVNASTL